MRNCLHHFFSVSFLRCLTFNPANGTSTTSFSLGESVNCASKKMNPTRAGKHQVSLASCLQSRRFCCSAGRRARMKTYSREMVVGKKQARRQVQGEGKALVWWYVRKQGSHCSLLPRMLLRVPLSSDRSHNTMKFSSASLHFLGIQKITQGIASNQSCCSADPAFTGGFHRWRALGLPAYRVSTAPGTMQLTWDRALCC